MGEDWKEWFLTAEEQGRTLNDADFDRMGEARKVFMCLADALEDLLPEGRRKSIVKSKLEEAAMYATKAITHG